MSLYIVQIIIEIDLSQSLNNNLLNNIKGLNTSLYLRLCLCLIDLKVSFFLNIVRQRLWLVLFDRLSQAFYSKS